MAGRCDNYVNAWQQGNFGPSFVNSVIITVPAVLLTLFLSSCTAFVLARFSYRFNLTLLGVFLAANLLPPQALLVPVFQMYRRIPIPEAVFGSDTLLNSHLGLILINVAFQMGFCTFVLSNYMKTLPFEIYESAQIDGASVLRQFWQLTLPLIRPALAALAVLQTTWIYNEFFWATVLIQSFDKLPVTSSLNNLRGQFFTDYNLLSAGSVLVALPVLVVFFVLQRQFVAGPDPGIHQGMSSVALRAAGTALVLDVDGPSLPRVAPLGRRRPRPGGRAGPARPAAASRCPTTPRTSRGRCRCSPRRPTGGRATRGSRGTGRAATPRRGSSSPDPSRSTTHPDGGGTLVATASDAAAGAEVEVRLALDPHGVVRTRVTVRSTAAEGVLDLAAVRVLLPLPASADEVLDLTGRWVREKVAAASPAAAGDAPARLAPRPHRARRHRPDVLRDRRFRLPPRRGARDARRVER